MNRKRRAPGRSWSGSILFQGLLLLVALLLSVPASADDNDEAPPPRPLRLEWEPEKKYLFGSMSYRDVVNESLRRKLSRGLPTTIVMTAAVFMSGKETPVATTLQSCKITWHVWEEAYRIELTQPGVQRTRWTTTLEGVLRRCAQVTDLLIATKSQLPTKAAVYLVGRIQVNPLSPELLERIKRWVSRPSATGTAGPGDALFGTFTGLFLQRIGEAEHQVLFRSYSVRPLVRPKPPEPPKKDKS